MITRIVKIHFVPDFTEHFKILFKEVQLKISASPGCKGVKLLNDVADPCTFFTISYWENESALNIYRDSVLFKETWAEVKVHFDEKPMAWSLETAE